MKIKKCYTGEVVFENDADTMRQTVLDAKSAGIDLRGADLREADLSGAYLRGAYLREADLRGAIGVYSFGPIGKSGRMGYAVDSADGVMFALGCFWGNEKEAITAIRAKYGPKSNYEAQVKLAAKIIKAGRK